MLAASATCISLAVSVLAGWELGATSAGRVVLAAGGALAVLGAHLLLTLCQTASTWVKFPAVALWLLCLLYAVYCHASFFQASQLKAGEKRAAAIEQASAKLEPPRSLAAVLSSQAKVKAELALGARVDCRTGCGAHRARLVGLKGELEALVAEAEDVKRWRVMRDRQDSAKDDVRLDPVLARFAEWIGVTVAQVGLATSLLFSCVLEGVACLCWYVSSQAPYPRAVRSVTPEVRLAPGLPPSCGADTSHAASNLEQKVAELVTEARAGRLRLTVDEVREHCRCGQKKASELTRQVKARLAVTA